MNENVSYDASEGANCKCKTFFDPVKHNKQRLLKEANIIESFTTTLHVLV